jgi:hypothetical protein
MLTVTERVRELTPEAAERIDREIARDVEYFRSHPKEVQERLQELNREPDVDRVFHTLAAAQAIVGLTLGAFVNRKWLIWPAIAAGFVLQDALKGWCPPVVGLRKLGLRTQQEIDEERCALKRIR